MESMGRKKPRPRRSFTPEFKAELVELCQRGDRSLGQVARDLDLTETAVEEWVKQAERDAGTRHDGGLTSAERQEPAELRRENRRLREDVGSSSGRRLSSPRRPGELLPVHRGGEGWQAQRRPGARRRVCPASGHDLIRRAKHVRYQNSPRATDLRRAAAKSAINGGPRR